MHQTLLKVIHGQTTLPYQVIKHATSDEFYQYIMDEIPTWQQLANDTQVSVVVQCLHSDDASLKAYHVEFHPVDDTALVFDKAMAQLNDAMAKHRDIFTRLKNQ